MLKSHRLFDVAQIAYSGERKKVTQVGWTKATNFGFWLTLTRHKFFLSFSLILIHTSWEIHPHHHIHLFLLNILFHFPPRSHDDDHHHHHTTTPSLEPRVSKEMRHGMFISSSTKTKFVLLCCFRNVELVHSRVYQWTIWISFEFLLLRSIIQPHHVIENLCFKADEEFSSFYWSELVNDVDDWEAKAREWV